jgi:hypothetical protein
VPRSCSASTVCPWHAGGSRSVAIAFVLVLALLVPALVSASTLDAAAQPSAATKLVFVHHSTGQAWLQDGYGGLAASLGANNYFVSDTNYGWGPDAIGDHTDIGDWWTWFRGPSASTYTPALYANASINSGYARSLSDPGGENTVVMFKSCFPNSNIGGSVSDPVPAIGENPLKGAGMSGLTVGNAKGVYLDLLEYFKAHPEKLFVLVVSPPLRESDTSASSAANARALANWLVDPEGLLKGYSAGNVLVFDYYTVLTGGHHRIVNGLVEHTAGPSNYLAYPTSDSHPSAAGDMVATGEFVPLLNAAYIAWKTGGTRTPAPSITPRTTQASKPSAGRTRLSRRSTYTWRGGVSPSQIGASSLKLEVQRKVGRKWRSYATISVPLADGASAWSKRVLIRRAGSYRIRARHADSDHAGAASGYREFTVR